MTTTVEVTLPIAAVLNTNQRPSRYEKAAKVSVIRTRFRIAAQTGQRQLQTPVRCIALLGFPDPGRKRDPNNWSDTTKAAIDGCVDAGLIPDDDFRHLIGPDHRIDPERCETGFVRVTLRFTTPERGQSDG